MKLKAMIDALLKLDGDSEVLISDVFEISEILKEQGRIFLTSGERDMDAKTLDNTYLVVNTDEPYSGWVADMIEDCERINAALRKAKTVLYEDYAKLLAKREKILVKREYCYNCKKETDWQMAYSNPVDLCCSQCGIYDWHNAELGKREQKKGRN